MTCLAAAKATGHAVGADLAIVDEAGLLQEKHRDLWNAMQSCISGRAGRLLAISIRGDGPMFAELADRATDPAVHWVEYAAPESAALDDAAAWHAANPGLGSIKSLDYMRDRVRAVLVSPADQSSFRAHDLNLPQAPSRELLCNPEAWRQCEVAAADLPRRDGRCMVGFDLGGNQSMTAAVAHWPGCGRLEVWAAFPDVPDLVTRGAADGVGEKYARMAERGELRTYPGRVVPPGRFLGEVAGDLACEVVEAAAADSYRRAEAEQALADTGVHWPMDWRSHGGGQEGSHDVRAFQAPVLQGEIRCRKSLVLRQAIAESDVKRRMGHPTLGRHRTRGRIDALAVAVLAVGVATDRPAARTASDYILHELYNEAG